MIESRLATHTFRRTLGGVTSFARVEVAFYPDEAATGISVIEDIQTPVDRDEGEVNVSSAPRWIAAALQGMDNIVVGVDCSKLRGELRLRRVIGTQADTTTDCIECAAALAAFESLFPGQTPPSVSTTKPWTLVAFGGSGKDRGRRNGRTEKREDGETGGRRNGISPINGGA